MPNRLLRDWTNSETLDTICWQAECFFTRLIMKADDYGSYYGNTKLLKSNLFPLRTDTVRDADISRWMAECQKAGLLVVYTDAGKDYTRIVNFGQRLRNKTKKFPDCPPDILANLEHDSHPPPSAAIRRELSVEEKRIEENRREDGHPAETENKNLTGLSKIPDRQKVQEAFYRNGGTVYQADKFFSNHDAAGWLDTRGRVITNFSALIPNFLAEWKRRDDQDIEKNTSNGKKKMVHS